MSMYLLTPEEAAHEAFVHGDSSAYAKLAANNIAEKKDSGAKLSDYEKATLNTAIENGWIK